MSAIFGNSGNIEQAYECLLSSNDCFEKIKGVENNFNYITLQMNLGQYYFKTNDLESAIVYANKAYELYVNGKYYGNIQKSINLIARIHEEKGDYKRALDFMKKYADYSDERENRRRDIKNNEKFSYIDSVNINASLNEKNNALLKSAKKMHEELRYKETNKVTKAKVVEDVLEALEKNEITTYFQCKHSLCSNHITGAEALVRWKKTMVLLYLLTILLDILKITL